MSSPRDRDPGDAFDDRPDDGSGWQRAGAPRRRRADGEAATPRGRRSPPGSRPAGTCPPAEPGPDRRPRPTAGPEWTGGPRFGDGARASRPMERAFRYRDRPRRRPGLGAAARLDDLRRRGTGGRRPARPDRAAPVRPGKDARPAGVLRGRAGTLELVAFDVAYPLGRSLVPKYAVTAAPLLGAVPRLPALPRPVLAAPAPAGSSRSPAGTRRSTPAGCCSPARTPRRCAGSSQDPAVQGLLLGTDDGDEFWTGAGHVAAIRPDGHRPQLLEHHARLLTALVGALAVGY